MKENLLVSQKITLTATYAAASVGSCVANFTLSVPTDNTGVAYLRSADGTTDVPLLRGESVTFDGVDLNTLFFKYGANGSGGTSATDFVTIVGYSFP